MRDHLMPVWSPPFGGPPFPMLSAELLMVEFSAKRDEIQRITPAPLEPANHNRLTAFVGECSQLSHSLRYHEVAILQEVSFEGRRATTVPYIWTSTDTALLAGRELYGMPKLLCDDDILHKSANEVSGSLHRSGVSMLELSMVIDEPADPSTLPFGGDLAMLRHIPSPDPDYPALQQLIWVELQEFAVHECWQGRGHIQFGHPLNSGLQRLGAQDVTGAWYGRFSWVLPQGKILQETKL